MTLFKEAVIIPDRHLYEGTNHRRNDALGNFIADRRPDYIVDLGDIGDYQCLRRQASRASIKAEALYDLRDQTDRDIEQVNEGIRRQFKPVLDLIEHQRHHKKRMYQFEAFLTKGNHDKRLDDMEAKYFVGEFALTKKIDYGLYQVTSYQENIEFEGITVSHNFGRFNDRISEEPTSTAQIRNTVNSSCITGHTHVAEASLRRAYTGKPSFVLQGGFFVDPTEFEDVFAYEDDPRYKNNWWNGITYLYGLDGTGYFEPEFIGFDRLLREYS